MNIQYTSMLRTASWKKLSEGFPFFQQLRNFKQRNIIFLFNSSSNLRQITKYIQFSLYTICYVQPATEFLHFNVHLAWTTDDCKLNSPDFNWLDLGAILQSFHILHSKPKTIPELTSGLQEIRAN